MFSQNWAALVQNFDKIKNIFCVKVHYNPQQRTKKYQFLKYTIENHNFVKN